MILKRCNVLSNLHMQATHVDLQKHDPVEIRRLKILAVNFSSTKKQSLPQFVVELLQKPESVLGLNGGERRESTHLPPEGDHDKHGMKGIALSQSCIWRCAPRSGKKSTILTVNYNVAFVWVLNHEVARRAPATLPKKDRLK